MTSTKPRNDAAGILILDGATIAAMTQIENLIDVAREALRKTSNNIAMQDIRRVLDLEEPSGPCMSIMYAAFTDQPYFGTKVLSVFPGNFAQGLPSHRGGILLFERTNGRLVALIDGGETTAWRTAAASAVATQELSRADSSILTVLGYGEQAQRHVVSIAAVRPIRAIRVWGRDIVKAEAFAQAQREAGFEAQAYDRAEDAVVGADVVCTVTSAREPLLFGRWLTPGTHVNAVGASVPSCRELDDDCIRRAQIWVDYMPMALTSAGEIVEGLRDGVIERSDIRGEIGAVIGGQMSGRNSDSEITLYRSLGVPAQDIELAAYLYNAAKAAGLGTQVALEDIASA